MLVRHAPPACQTARKGLPLTGFVPVDPDLYLVSSRYFEIGLSFRHDQIALGSQLLGSESMIQT